MLLIEALCCWERVGSFIVTAGVAHADPASNLSSSLLQVTLAHGETGAEGFVNVGATVEGNLISEENLPEVIAARLAAPETKERGFGEGMVCHDAWHRNTVG